MSFQRTWLLALLLFASGGSVAVAGALSAGGGGARPEASSAEDTPPAEDAPTGGVMHVHWDELSRGSRNGTSASGGEDGAAQVKDSAVTPEESASCSTGKALPFFVFHNIMSNPDLLRVEFANEEKTQVRIRVPTYFNACIDEMTPKVHFSDNNLHFRMEIDKDYSEYITCLKEGEYVDEDGRPNQEKFAKTISDDAMNYVYNVRNFSVDENMAVIFESPFPDDDNGNVPPVFGTADPRSSECYLNELVREGGFNLHISRENVATEWAYDLCTRGGYEQILEGLASLEDSTLGNAALLRSVLQQALEEERKERIQAIYARLEGINDAFTPSEDDDEVPVSESQARRLASEYRRLAREIDEILLQPAKEKLASLIEEYNESVDDEKKDALEEEINRITDSIRDFGHMRHEHFDKGLEEYALIDRARDIEEIKHKSILYERIYAGHPNGRGRRLSPDSADREVERRLQTFDNILEDWRLAYGAKRGDKRVLQTQRRRVQQANRRMSRTWARYQKNEMNMQKRLCGRSMFSFRMKNPSGCRHFMANSQRRHARAMRIRGRNHAQVMRAESNYNRYSTLYEEYNAGRAEDALDGDDYYGYFGGDFNFGGGGSVYDAFSGSPGFAQPGAGSWGGPPPGGAGFATPFSSPSHFGGNQPFGPTPLMPGPGMGMPPLGANPWGGSPPGSGFGSPPYFPQYGGGQPFGPTPLMMPSPGMGGMPPSGPGLSPGYPTPYP